MRLLRKTVGWVAAVIAIALFVPLAGAALIAAITAIHVGDDPRSAALLVQTLEARQPYSIRMYSMISLDDLYRDCGVKEKELGDSPANFNQPQFSIWNPHDAEIVLSAILGNWEQRQGDGARDRYINRHTTEFSRRFLLGCMDATDFAGICARHVSALVEEYNRNGPQGWERKHFDRIAAWNVKTMCAFLHGAREQRTSTATDAKASEQ